MSLLGTAQYCHPCFGPRAPRLPISGPGRSPSSEEGGFAQSGDRDAFDRALQPKIKALRRIFLSSTRIEGRFILRVCMLHLRTGGAQVELALEEIRQTLGE